MKAHTTLFFLFLTVLSSAQSIELMPGSERIFVDVQWFRTLDENSDWSLFSRSRATVDYDDNTDLFTGAYVNYTLPSGLGGTLVGRISATGAGSDVGIHLFKANDQLMVYALASLAISQEFGYSWFSIVRYTPRLSQYWDLFTGLELFSSFDEAGHVVSVQRLRLGLDKSGLQFGFGLNLTGLGRRYDLTDSNPGIFIRTQF